MNETQTVGQLAIRFGNSKKLAAVDSISHASRVWCQICDEQALLSSESPKVTVVDTATGKVVARISYNGRAWDNDGKEIAL